MHRILLVKCTTNFPAMTFPLGLLYLSAAMKQAHPEVPVKVYDLRLKGHGPEDLRRVLAEFRPTIVGISFISVEIGNFAQTVRLVKSADRSITILAGGPHPSSDPMGTLGDHPECSFAAVGEGEETFVAWYEAFAAGMDDYGAVAGLYWRGSDGAVIANRPRDYIREVDDLPDPDYDQVRLEDYWDEWSMGYTTFSRFHRYANLFTSRACPYKCTYCHDLFGKGFRAMSPVRVVDQMERLQRRYGIEEFEIVDDIFNFNADRLTEICRLIVERGLQARLSFPNGLRTDRLDAEQIAWLRRAGTKFVAVAVETATPRLQKQIRKNLKTDHVFRMIDELYRQRIYTRGYFMIGFPSETAEEIRATLRYAWRSKLATAFFFIVVPYKGTRIEQENRALVESMDIDYGTIDYWANRYNLSAVSDRQMRRFQRSAVLRFYLSPRRAWYLLRLAPSIPRFLGAVLTQSVHAVLVRALLKAPMEKDRYLHRRLLNGLKSLLGDRRSPDPEERSAA